MPHREQIDRPVRHLSHERAHISALVQHLFPPDALAFIFAGDVQVAAYPGRIIITEPQGLVQPRIEEKDKVVQKHVVLNGQTVLPCIAQAHPVPTYRYACVYVCSC